MSKIPKVIIVAAGRGIRLKTLTNNKPKCLIKIRGKTILQRILEIFRGCGISDITVVRGYKRNLIKFPGLKYYDDINYQGILGSLMFAQEEMNDEFIATYSDILFDKSIVEALLESDKDISLVIDTDWQEYYQGRTEHPIEEAENVVIENSKITKIGKHLTVEEAHGEFIGMVKFSKKGAEIFRKEFQRVKNMYTGKSFQKATTFEKAYLTDMLQELIDQGIDIHPVKIRKSWWEIDTKQDLEKVIEIFNSLKKA